MKDAIRSGRLDAPLLAAASFAVYAAGACRTIYVGDSGELVAAAATLGIPHPSGYPLYVLLGWLWIHVLPIGSIALRMSLFSAACAAAAVGGLAWLVRRSVDSSEEDRPSARVAGLFAGALLAVSPSFWSQANVQRVYALNALCLVVVLVLVRRWLETRRTGWMVAAAFATGLGASNHTFLALAGLAIGAAVVIEDPTWLRRPKDIAVTVGAAILGLAPYAYLPIRSAQDPNLDWGNPETLDGFLHVVLRKDFWDRKWIEGPADLVPILFDWVTSLGAELLWVGALLAVVGVLAARRFGWPAALPLAIIAVNAGSMALHGSRSDLFIWHRYYIPSYLMCALLAGFGVAHLLRRLEEADRGALRRVAVAFCVAAPLLAAVVFFSRWDRSRYRVAEDFARQLLEQVPPGAHLAASDDNILFVLIYLQQAEWVRPDLDLVLQGVSGELPALRFDPDDDPLFFTHHPNWNLPQLEVVPVGLVFRVARAGTDVPLHLPRGASTDEHGVVRAALDGEDDSRVPKDYLTRNLIGHFHFMLGVSHETRHWPTTQVQFAEAMEMASTNDVLFYNIGLIYERNGLFDRALAAFERAAEINPRHIPSNRPVRPVDRVAEARRRAAAARQVIDETRRAAGLPMDTPLDAPSRARLAELLHARGETLLARGQMLLAREAAAGLEVDS